MKEMCVDCSMKEGEKFMIRVDLGPTVISEELTQKCNEKICQNSGFSIDKLHQNFPQVSRSVLYEIVTNKKYIYVQDRS